jgi:hypothetical protein
MLPIYTAILLEKGNVKGGTTLPCQMTVVNNEGTIIGSYIVKVFGQRHIEQYNPTNKEIIANYLASEFDLTVPKMAIINVSQAIIDELKTQEAYQNVILTAGYYFGCQFIENTLSYEIGIKTTNYELWELETIFAFDVFIRNYDRRIRKPNILFKNGNFILIDHDLSLDIHKSYAAYKAFDNYQNVIQGVKGRHIFLEHLQKLHKKKPISFDDFIESLRTLNIGKLHQLKEFLESLDFDTADFEQIITYLEAVKQNLSEFKKLLLINL